MARYNMTVVKVAKALYVADKTLRDMILADAEICIETKHDDYENVDVDIEMIKIDGAFYSKINRLASQWRNYGAGWGKVDFSVFKDVKGYELLGIRG